MPPAPPDRATPNLPRRDLAATARFYAALDPRAGPRLTPPVAEPWGFLRFALVDADGNLFRGLEPLGSA